MTSNEMGSANERKGRIILMLLAVIVAVCFSRICDC